MALPTRGQKSFVSKIQHFAFDAFDLGHPVFPFQIMLMIGFCSVQSLNIVEYVQSPEEEINGSVRYTTSEEEKELIQQQNEHQGQQQKAKYFNQIKAALRLCYENGHSNDHVSHFFNDKRNFSRGK